MKMKCMLTTAIVLSALNSAIAQNTFPSTGNVGVGTTTPANKFTVRGDGISISNESASGTVKVGFYLAPSAAYVQTHTNHPLFFATSNSNAQMSILTNGNVGVGTITPGERLTVYSTTNTLGFSHTDGIVKLGSQLNTSGSYIGALFGTISNHPLYLRTNNVSTPQITLLQNGNVGIGKTNPAKLLDIAGDIAVSGTINGANGGSSTAYNVYFGDHIPGVTGTWNTAIGSYCMAYNTTGWNNTAVGGGALVNNTAGSGNIALGARALDHNTAGVAHIAIGTGAGSSLPDSLQNAIMIGYGVSATASQQVRIGDEYITSIGGYANWTNISDGRVKRNIQANVPGLSFINKLMPVTYNLNLDIAERLTGSYVFKQTMAKDDQIKKMMQDGKKAKEKIIYSGFIAQDVEKAAQSLNYDFSGVDAPKNDRDIYGLRYAEFVVPLVKAVQELSKMNEEKDAQIKNMQQQINEIKELLKASKQTTGDTKQNTKLSSASLLQNVPNPFNNSTNIAYILPEKYNHAKMVISDKAGRTVKEFPLTGKASGTISINSSELNAGAYQYSLYVNDALVQTKQMIAVK